MVAHSFIVHTLMPSKWSLFWRGVSAKTGLLIRLISIIQLIYQIPLVGDHVAVVIPAFNEEVTIGTVVLKALNICNEVYVVNDGSTDMTSNVAELAGAIVLEMEHSSDKAAAFMKGLQAAKRDGYSVIVIMDGTAQHMSKDMQALLAPIVDGTADIVIGSRFLKENNEIPAYRQFGQKVLNTFTRWDLREN